MFKLYNGAPNRELQEHWVRRKAARVEYDKAVKVKYGDQSRGVITYFPLEKGFDACVFVDDKCILITDRLYITVEACSSAAISKLNQPTEESSHVTQSN